MSISSASSADISANLADFDWRSGSFIERLLFNNRLWILLTCILLTAALGWQLGGLRINASFDKMLPTQHPYVVNYLKYRSELAGAGNQVRIAVHAAEGTILDEKYLETLRKISDAVYLLPGVDRSRMKSLWTPNSRWLAVTEDGLEGGPIIPDDYSGSGESVAAVKANIERSGEVGQIVAADFRSSIIVVPLLSVDTQTGQPLDYTLLAERLEELRAQYTSSMIELHMTGFAKVVGDLIDAMHQILAFFVVALAMAAGMLFAYTRCVRSTVLVVCCSLIAVVWQLGLLPLLGYTLNPYTILVPFLVFAIGMSHGAQKMNGIMQDIGRGASRLVAARLTFRRLFLAGLTALLCDAVGFAVLGVIRIPIIQDLAVIASIGVGVLVFTNLLLLPILLSYVGVNPAAAARSLRDEGGEKKHPMWAFLDRFTTRRWAAFTVLVTTVLTGLGFVVSLGLKIGDLDPGAPELRADSRYNRDAAYMTANYGASSDVFVVIGRTADSQCANYDVQRRMDALEWDLRQMEEVESTASLASLSRKVFVFMSEGNPKWYELLPAQSMLNSVTNQVPPELFNSGCNTLALMVYLKDHKADTLQRVVDKVETFAQANSTEEGQFLLAAGSAGLEAATNMVVKQATREMLYWVYGAVILLCLVTFRSWRAVVCAVVPLVVTSILCEALMATLGMGVKVATLPVIALGVGIGVDYALYVMSVMLSQLRLGATLSQAYYIALTFTGRVVMLTGFTLAAGVATWAFSPIKFQADMGILLAFMFIWNMVGALVLLPALAHFLLKPLVSASHEVLVVPSAVSA